MQQEEWSFTLKLIWLKVNVDYDIIKMMSINNAVKTRIYKTGQKGAIHMKKFRTLDHVQALKVAMQGRNVLVLSEGKIREAHVSIISGVIKIHWKCREGYSISSEEIANYGKTWSIIEYYE